MYAIDRIENGIIIAEELSTKQKLEIKESDFPFTPSEGKIFVIKNGVIKENNEIEQERRKSIREKLEKIKSHE